jgi:hypothetical protein
MCRQLQDQESGRSAVAPRDLRELMAVLPNVDLTDTLEIPRVFRCDEQTLPCDHTSRYRSTTGWCNNLRHPEWGKSLRAFVRLLPPAYHDGEVLYDHCRIERRGRMSEVLSHWDRHRYKVFIAISSTSTLFDCPKTDTTCINNVFMYLGNIVHRSAFLHLLFVIIKNLKMQDCNMATKPVACVRFFQF